MATYPESLQGILIILVYKTLGTLLKVLNGLISPPFDTIAILVKLMTLIRSHDIAKMMHTASLTTQRRQLDFREGEGSF